MRGIRIWHLAALALSVPLVAAAVPSGCTGGLNPNFRDAIGQGAGTAIPIPNGYVVLGIFNETGWPGHFDFDVTGGNGTWATGWAIGFGIAQPQGEAWACSLTSLGNFAGEVFVPDATGVPQATALTYSGPALLQGNRIGDPLECGTLVKARIVPAATGTATQYQIIIELLK